MMTSLYEAIPRLSVRGSTPASAPAIMEPVQEAERPPPYNTLPRVTSQGGSTSRAVPIPEREESIYANVESENDNSSHPEPHGRIVVLDPANERATFAARNLGSTPTSQERSGHQAIEMV